jgi:hypothetical protein
MAKTRQTGGNDEIQRNRKFNGGAICSEEQLLVGILSGAE